LVEWSCTKISSEWVLVDREDWACMFFMDTDRLSISLQLSDIKGVWPPIITRNCEDKGIPGVPVYLIGPRLHHNFASHFTLQSEIIELNHSVVPKGYEKVRVRLTELNCKIGRCTLVFRQAVHAVDIPYFHRIVLPGHKLFTI